MDRVRVTLASRNYDFVLPLATGDVTAEGIDLVLLREFGSLDRLMSEGTIDGGEGSFSQHLYRVAAGDRSFVGLPVFLMREFRQRCVFVRRDSPLKDLAELAGRPVGIYSWPASGSVWSRALLREIGIPIDGLDWVLGGVNPKDPPPAETPPRFVRLAPPERSLSELLLEGQIEAIMCPWPPTGFYTPTSRVRRLYEDYRTVEREYFLRTRLYPAHHLLILRRALVDRHPWVVPNLYRAFERAYEHSDESHWVLHETSPWVLADLEDQRRIMGPDFHQHGYRENRAMVAAFCEEQFAQGFLRDPVDPDMLFGEFEKLIA